MADEQFFVTWSDYDGAHLERFPSLGEVMLYLVSAGRDRRVGEYGFTGFLVIKGVEVKV
jgi:hypothetical protein